MDKIEKERLKNKLGIIYPQRRFHIKKARKAIQNKDFSLLASNCMGGIIYNNLGLKFNSPTINMQMFTNEYYNFIINLEEYLKMDIVFIEPDNGIPVGMLGDMKIHFTHYRTNEEALEKWNERKSRLNLDNLYILFNDKDGITEEQIINLSNVKCKNLCVFTSKEYPDLPYTFYVEKYKGEPCVGNLLWKSRKTGLREFETKFDYVKWLNSTLDDNLDYHI